MTTEVRQYEPSSDQGREIITAIREVATEKPDFVYERPVPPASYCLYVYEGRPSCLIGQALWRRGYIDEHLEGCVDNQATVGSLLAHLDHMDALLSPADLKWIGEVQFSQDTGLTWGNAIMQADSLLQETLEK